MPLCHERIGIMRLLILVGEIEDAFATTYPDLAITFSAQFRKVTPPAVYVAG